MPEKKGQLVAEFVGAGVSRGRHRKRARGPQQLGSIRWEGFSHRHMWNMIMDARPDDVFDRYDRWMKLGENLVAVNKTLQGELNALFQSWQGTAALSSALSNTRLLQWSQDAAETTQRIGENLGHYGNALVEARKRMPQPRAIDAENNFRAGDGATVWNGPENAYLLLQVMSDHRASSRERAEAKERAIEVMQTFEGESAQVEGRLDTYSTSPDVVHHGDPEIQPPPPDPGPGPDGGPGVPMPDPVDWPSPTDPATSTGPAGVHPTPGGPGYGPNGPGFGGLGPGAGGPGPGGGQGGAGGYPGGGPGGLGAGGLAGGHPPGSGAGGPAYGASNRGIGGALPPGAAAAEAAAARGAGGAAAAGAARGGGGMMYPPMAGGVRGDDEHEKRVAPYLVDDDDLFDDDRTVAPPVFGA